MPIFPQPVWLSYLALAIVTALPMFASAVAGQVPAPPPAVAGAPVVDFSSAGPIELSRSGGNIGATIVVRNDAPDNVKVVLAGIIFDRRGQLLAEVSHEATVSSGRQSAIRFEIPLAATPANAPREVLRSWWDPRLPARGLVTLVARKSDNAVAPPTIRSREVLVNQLQPPFFEYVLNGLALMPSMLLVAWGFWLSRGVVVGAAAAAPRWSPQSWSSNLAISGALLTSVLGTSALPAQTHYLPRVSYTVLSVFFAALVALAPPLYGLMKAGGTPTPAGALRLFSMSAGITIWATVGQLGATALLMAELEAARVISIVTASASVAVMVAVAVIVVLYGFRAVASYLEKGSAPVQPSPGARGATPPPAEAGRPWILL